VSDRQDASATANTAPLAGDGGAAAGGTEPYLADASTAPTSDLAIGATIGRYRVERILGSGATGVVLAAFDDELGRRVAIKFLVREHTEARGRLIREAKAMAQLSHPNVVTVHEVLRLSDRVGVVMAMIEGQTLAAWQADAPRTWREIVDAYVQAGRGLAAAHRAGLVHRDFKPTNALIDRDGVVRVTDFGLVRLTSLAIDLDAAPSSALEPPGAGGPNAPNADDLTRTGAVLGTPAFMAPEQHRGEPADARSDQWSFACALHGALYGQRPFHGDSYASLSAAVIAGELRPEPEATAVSAPVRAAIRRGLAVRPADRFPSLDAMIDALAPRPRRWPVIATGALAVGTVAAAIAFAPGGGDGTCAGLDAPIAVVWGPRQAAALRDRATARGASVPASIVTGAVDALDRYRASWIAGRTAACVEAQQGTASAVRLDRRMSCLDDRLAEVGALVGALGDADADALRRAHDAVQDLHPVADCDDPQDLVSRPSDPAVRAELARGHDSWAQAWALAELGKFIEGMPLAQQAAEIADRAGWPPLIARAQTQLGLARSHANDGPGAVAAFERAAMAAAEGKDDDELAHALISQVFTVAYQLGRPDDALAMKPYVELALARAGQPPRLRGNWLHHLAITYYLKDRFDDAQVAEAEALAIFERMFAPDHVEVVDSTSVLGSIELARGEYAVAKRLFERALTAHLAIGDTDVGEIYTNLGVIEEQLGNPAAAMAHHERADEIEGRNARPSWVAPVHLGLARLAVGRWTAARDPLDRAVAAAAAVGAGKGRQVAITAIARAAQRIGLGDLAGATADLDGALAATDDPVVRRDVRGVRVLARLAAGDAAAARAELAAGDGEAEGPRRSALLELARGELARRAGDCAAAVTAYDVAAEVPLTEGALVPTTEVTLGRAECELARGAAADAVKRTEARLTWLEAQAAEPAALARLQWTLARALDATGSDRARARQLAEAARAGYAPLGAPGKARAAEIQRWLAAR
jgi:tetratricopeptide (TPR) repeat protein